MESTELQFYKFCADNKLEIKAPLSESMIQRIKLKLINNNLNLNITDFVHAYEQGKKEAMVHRNESKKAVKRNEIENALKSIFEEGQKRKSFWIKFGREHKVATIKSYLDISKRSCENARDSVISFYDKHIKQYENRFNINYDLNSIQLQTHNYLIQEFAKLDNKYKRLCNEVSVLENYVIMSENLLTDESQQQLYFNKLKIEEPSIFVFENNNYTVYASFSRENTIIYGDVEAEIEGSLYAKIYDGDELVETIKVFLPIYNDKYPYTIIGTGVLNHAFVNVPKICFTNNKLWAIEKNEKIQNTIILLDSVHIFLHKDDIKGYVENKNEKLVLTEIEKRLNSAKDLVNKTNNKNKSLKIKFYTQAIDILKTLPINIDITEVVEYWPNLFEELYCFLSDASILLKYCIEEKEQLFLKIKQERICILLIICVIILLMLLML